MAGKKEEKSTMDVKKFTKFEKARIIGTRAMQIADGAPLLLKFSDDDLKRLRYDPITIAQKEFESGLVPLDVIRVMPPFLEKIGVSEGGDEEGASGDSEEESESISDASD